jgi:hypothetical protein
MHASLQFNFTEICRNCQLLLDLSVGRSVGYFSRSARAHHPKPEACQQRRVSMAVAACLTCLSRVEFSLFGALKIMWE